MTSAAPPITALDRDATVALAADLATRATDCAARAGFLPNDFLAYRAKVAAGLLPFLLQEQWTVTERHMHGLSGGDAGSATQAHGPDQAWGTKALAAPLPIRLSQRADLLRQAVDRMDAQLQLWALWRASEANDWRHVQAHKFTKVLTHTYAFAEHLVHEAEEAALLRNDVEHALDAALAQDLTTLAVAAQSGAAVERDEGADAVEPMAARAAAVRRT